MTEHLKIGDVVQLRSGGPKMTVVWIDMNVPEHPTVGCSWFDDQGKEHKGDWPLPSLIKFPPESIDTA